MNEERPEGLSREERAAYSSLRREPGPPEGLEDRVVEELASRGLIAREQGILAALVERFRGIPLAPRMGLAMAALAGTFVLGVEVGRRADEPAAPEAVLDPAPAATEERADEGVIMVAGWRASGAETSYVQVSAVAKPLPGGDDGGDFRPYPLDGEIRPYSVSR
jgi:hypothetical protein